MIKVQPKVYFLAGTKIEDDNILQYLEDLAQNNCWSTNTANDSDGLIEFAGRLCYRSWKEYDGTLATNPNVTKVRKDNLEYIQNLIKQAHGSCLEHSNLTLLFDNVSRVFTHEIVRHRAGMSFSQESLRYVRLDELKFWFPPEVEENPELEFLYRETVEYLENVQTKLNEIVKLDGMKFAEKKKWTSRFRRLAPIGLATTILVTGNLRAWRHIVNMRGSEGAEEEIKLVMDQVVPIIKNFSPAVFADLEKVNNEWKFKLNPKP